jgi:hypothetical protein
LSGIPGTKKKTHFFSSWLTRRYGILMLCATVEGVRRIRMSKNEKSAAANDKDSEHGSWWARNLIVYLILPALATILGGIGLAGIGFIEGWWHQRVGFDKEGHPLSIASPDKAEPKKEGPVENGTKKVDTGKKSTDEPRHPVKTADSIKAIATNLGGLEPNERSH